MAGALGIPQQPSVDLAMALANHGSMLLVLDNLDEVASSAAPILGRWLDHCADLQLLITSIVPVAMDGEVRVEMGPLEVAYAVALYLERANRAWAGKTFAEGDQEAIQELVTRLDRSPLAIEFAAARVRVLTPKALLQAEEGDPPRFSLFESVRDFAALELQRSGEEERILRIHATYFAEEGEQRCRDLKGPTPLPSVRWLQGERKNLIAAHRNCLASDPQLAAEVGHVLASLFDFEGPPASEVELLDSVIDAARRSGDPGLLIRGLRYRSVSLTRLGRMREASVDSEEGLELARLHGDEVSEGFLLVNVGRHQTLAGNLDTAEASDPIAGK